MSRKRVLIVISNLEYGGAQRQAIELLNNLDSSEYEPYICSLSDYAPLKNTIIDADRRLIIIQKQWKFDISVVFKLIKLIKQLRIDIIHSFLFDSEIASRLAGRLCSVRAIIGSERNSNYSLKWRQLIAYRLTRNSVGIIIANSWAGAKFNSKMQGLPVDRYRVIHNGIDTNRFFPRPNLNEYKTSLGFDISDRLVGMFASFKTQKNHMLALKAMKRVFNQIPNTKFLMVGEKLHAGMHGSDAYYNKIWTLVDQIGIREHCFFLGNRDDVEKLYCACDLTILPSLFEGTPNALLESMACGTPVIATDVSDNSIIIQDGISGLIVPLGDDQLLSEKIIGLLRNKTLLQQYGENASRRIIKEYTSKKLAEKTAFVYEEALARNNKKSLRPRLIEKKRAK
ncbi:glycosyltransferase [Desulfopila aestuarii]|uniref:Glycosyltransferase involved in cell wall bisynthesis n=1 Tax=Desulfopila aestuarii DSM 18488 TaxID=1121416 RepID=A0A1M7YFR4_9BACT|nr:glycosyltransferase [Desulfopila aestuarii]SHO51482.1 Glycosyltransferase involved in cell wall bisynthesis [Desulfopila aestuarii DSM 18488]